MGHRLFRSTKETFQATFVVGNALDSAHLAAAPVLTSPPEGPPPTLASLTSLNPLRGHVAAIYVGAFFHLFTEEQQAQIVRALAGLLSPVPGSMIVGMHSGAESQKGTQTAVRGIGEGGLITQFKHSPETWTELWDGDAFEKGAVKVETAVRKRVTTVGTTTVEHVGLVWSVTRL